MAHTVMVRSKDAGVFYGSFIRRDGTEVALLDARRIWYWAGALTLSELATEGTTQPKDCKFPVPTVGEHLILGVCEVIQVTDRAKASLDSVAIWRQT